MCSVMESFIIEGMKSVFCDGVKSVFCDGFIIGYEKCVMCLS